MPDFTQHKHPVLAVPCRDCSAPVGVWCKHPSGRRAAQLHRARRELADRTFVDQHGPGAEIRYDKDFDQWQIENSGFGTSPGP